MKARAVTRDENKTGPFIWEEPRSRDTKRKLTTCEASKNNMSQEDSDGKNKAIGR